MADFSYVGSGSIESLGNAYCYTIDIFLYKFRVGDFAYVRENAIRGRLFKVRVAKVFLNNTSLNYNKKVSLYEDSTGSLYNESDLITYEEASELIQLSPWAGVTEPFHNELELLRYAQSMPIESLNEVYATYGPGDFVWSLPDARRGDLLKVVIKKVISQNVFEDQLNGLWNLDDLVDEITATNIAYNYWLRRKRKIQKAVLNDPLVRPPVQRPY
jgi:hypothetical protein